KAQKRLSIGAEKPVERCSGAIGVAPGQPGLVAAVIAPVELVERWSVRPAVDQTAASPANLTVVGSRLDDQLIGRSPTGGSGSRRATPNRSSSIRRYAVPANQGKNPTKGEYDGAQQNKKKEQRRASEASAPLHDVVEERDCNTRRGGASYDGHAFRLTGWGTAMGSDNCSLPGPEGTPTATGGLSCEAAALVLATGA